MHIFLASFLNVNIFVFSYTDKKISILYKEQELNTYKKNIFVNEIDGIFYPLTYKLDNGRYFKYNSTLLNNVLFSKYITAYNTKNNKEFIISNNWESILGDYLKVNTSNIVIDLDQSLIQKMSDSDSDTDSDIDYENLTEEIKYLNEKMESNNSEDLNLESSDEDEDEDEEVDSDSEDEEVESEDEEAESEDDDENKMKLIQKLKDFSDSKLKSLKKNDLIDYLSQLVDINESTKKETKQKSFQI